MSDQLDLFDIGGAPTPPVRGKRRPDGGRPPVKARVSPPSPERPAPPTSTSLGRGASPAATETQDSGLAASPETEGTRVLATSSEEASLVPPLEEPGRDMVCMTCYRVTYVIEIPAPFIEPMKYKCGECLERKA